ncbi:hypothetical protein BBK82_42365 [Lentzea guizhouensis]|uniref:Uncharacterized protein n=1 Tax=Lentzea guizhouensis TaxID=1586287 RepID=A0A1B2HV47_9PSEU|nr:hypothetical protein [Lentzea guizhouensis]ANZ41614.1 hypothetical protein BBK82_42365 [Lentzea guizhouensis]
MTERIDAVVAEYLARVAQATEGLPADRRDELVRDLREHIETSRADLPAETEAQVRGILERLGEPVDIARAASEDAGVSSNAGSSQGAGLSQVAVEERPQRLSVDRLVAVVVGVVLVLVVITAALFLTQSSSRGTATALVTTGHGLQV